MTNSQVPWQRLASLAEPPEGMDDQPVLTSFLSKAFYFSVGRNAWWGSWSSTYPGDHAFAPEPSTIKKRIEAQRVQGSQFTLKELPALALMGQHYELLLFQTWGNAPFGKIPRSAISGKTMFEVARSICKHEQWINTFIGPSGTACRPILPFKMFRSRPQGAGYPLAWDRLDDEYELGPVMALVADVTLHLNNE
jgi:hypothetical protein